MDSRHLSETMISLILVLIVQSEGKTEIGDYIVDCSACQFAPLIEVKSYSCMVRCEAQGEVNSNLTSLYDMVTQMFKRQTSLEAELVETKEKLEETERKLSETVEKLAIDVAFTVSLSARITFNIDDTILFDVILSDVSNGYDVATGVFTVPHNGTYDLTLRTMTVQNAELYTNLLVNEDKVCSAHGKGTNFQGMCTATRKLVQGDRIFARNIVYSRQYNGGYCSLSGHLVHLD